MIARTVMDGTRALIEGIVMAILTFLLWAFIVGGVVGLLLIGWRAL